MLKTLNPPIEKRQFTKLDKTFNIDKTILLFITSATQQKTVTIESLFNQLFLFVLLFMSCPFYHYKSASISINTSEKLLNRSRFEYFVP